MHALQVLKVTSCRNIFSLLQKNIMIMIGEFTDWVEGVVVAEEYPRNLFLESQHFLQDPENLEVQEWGIVGQTQNVGP